jgi:magnesium-transporting ATPase (P-type)
MPNKSLLNNFLSSLIFAFLQFGLHDVRDDFIRLEERPFSSVHKWMAVKCKSKRQLDGKVGCSSYYGDCEGVLLMTSDNEFNSF